MTSKLRTAQAVCLALTLTVVPAILCAVTVSSSYAIYLEYKDWQRRRGEPVDSATHEALVVDSEGRAAVAIRDSRGKAMRYLDAKRVPINGVNENVHWLVGSRLFRVPQNLVSVGGPQDFPIVSLRTVGQVEHWFFVCDRPAGRALFEGYDAATHRRIGYIGMNGFDEGPRDESNGFPVSTTSRLGVNQDLWTRDDFVYRYRERVTLDSHDPLRVGQWVLQSGERLFLIDSVARSVTELFPGMQVRSVVHAARVLPVAPDQALPAAAAGEQEYGYQKWVAARTADRVVLINPNTGRREEYVLPASWNDRDFELYLPSDGTAVLTSNDLEGYWRDTRPGIREYEVDVAAISPAGAGEISRQARFTLQVTYSPNNPSQRAQYWLPTLAIPGPLPSAVIAGVVLPWFDSRVRQTRFADRAVVSLGEAWPVLVFVTLLAIGLAWLSDRHLRAFREPRSYVWLAFILLLGLPGYVGWHCHRRWPVRHPVPPPEKTGIEIFA